MINRAMNSESFITQRTRNTLMAMAIGGLLVLALGYAVSPVRVWSNLLIVAFYFVTVALGGAVFIAMNYATGAGWSVAFRRVPEAMAKLLPYACAALFIVLALRYQDYGWTLHHDGHEVADPGSFWFKQYWLNPPFWLARAVGYMVVWCAFAAAIVGISRKQDRVGGMKLTGVNVRLSAIFIAVYAITFSMASMDWVMALEPLWFSTMWGVYQFAGMLQSTLAVIVVMALLLRRTGGPLYGIFSDEHLHDLGKLLLAFSCFWMYIWFSQYMLIWYSNIPEETTYFVARTHGPWGPIVLISIVLNWIIPFFVLLPKPSKRSERVMMKVALVVLIGRWVDLSVMIFPPTVGELPVLGIWEIAGVCLLIGSFGLLFARAFAKSKPVPTGDPYYGESLGYHNA